MAFICLHPIFWTQRCFFSPRSQAPLPASTCRNIRCPGPHQETPKGSRWYLNSETVATNTTDFLCKQHHATTLVPTGLWFVSFGFRLQEELGDSLLDCVLQEWVPSSESPWETAQKTVTSITSEQSVASKLPWSLAFSAFRSSGGHLQLLVDMSTRCATRWPSDVSQGESFSNHLTVSTYQGSGAQSNSKSAVKRSKVSSEIHDFLVNLSDFKDPRPPWFINELNEFHEICVVKTFKNLSMVYDLWIACALPMRIHVSCWASANSSPWGLSWSSFLEALQHAVDRATGSKWSRSGQVEVRSRSPCRAQKSITTDFLGENEKSGQ